MGKGSGRGGDSGSSPPALPPAKISHSELQKHASDKDAWLLIDGQVYDVSSFQHRHPGGLELLGPWAGRDASAPFHAFHPEPAVPQKYLPSLLLVKGRRAAPLSEAVADDDCASAGGSSTSPTPEEDLEKVRAYASRQGWFEPSVFFYTWNLTFIVLLEAVAWYVLAYVGAGWAQLAVATMLLATSQVQAGFLQHDFGHSSVFTTRKANKLMHCLIIGHFKAASSSWWDYRHFRHHSQPNIVDEDPDIDVPYLFLLGDVIPQKTGHEKTGFHTLYHYQHLYWWLIGPPLFLPLYVHLDVLMYLLRTRNWYDLALSFSFFARWHLQFSPLLGVSGMCGLYLAARFVESHWFTWCTQMSHLPMDIDFHKGAGDSKAWIRLQLESTVNVHPSFFNDWFTGHLNFQIEHHLMPTMPRHNYRKVKPLIEDLCRKHNIRYRSKTLLGAMGDIVAAMKTSGQLWLEAYHLDR
jgi:fatty acid desaturase